MEKRPKSCWLSVAVNVLGTLCEYFLFSLCVSIIETQLLKHIRPRNFWCGNCGNAASAVRKLTFSPNMMKHVADGIQIEALERQFLIRVRRRWPHD